MNKINRLAGIGVLVMSMGMFAEPVRSVVMPDEETSELFCQHTSAPMLTRNYPITFIEQDAIDAQHQKLVQELKLNTLARYGVKAATAAVLVYVAYEVWLSQRGNKDYIIPAESIMVPDGQGVATQGELNRVDHRVTVFGNQLHAHIQENYPQWLSWQWFKNGAKSIGWSVINIALAKGVFDRIENSIDSIMHNGNLDWFVKTHTKSLETLVELTEYAHTHDTPGATDREHAHHKEQIMQVTQSFINNMTAILGFMSYSKSGAADPQIRVNMHTLIEYFRITCNEFSQLVTQALEQDTAVTPHMSKMSVELNRILMSFMRLEREQAAE
ncbi:MAG: hypothetical protein ACHQVS_02510 [Candidatus Babeliales bacterium]